MSRCITNWALRGPKEVFPAKLLAAPQGRPDQAGGWKEMRPSVGAWDGANGGARWSIGALTDRKGCRYTGESRSPGERVGMTCMGSRAAMGRLRGTRLSRRPDPRPAESAEEAVSVV
jgi:hypothetical protein